ncbi:MAG TPA: ABC transporter permease subunit [Chloroflexi bacterium]|nr:ABC transporter permease subunit [Chloroflexota bacterium]
MTVLSTSLPRVKRSSLANALVITRREIKDNFRDWRIMAPIFILTLIFPALMNFTAQIAINWVTKYDAVIVGERMIPFLLMIVGFFPISFSLVIALETFAGEKERNSIEPLLSMPVTDLELYAGKMLAALFVPLTASYFGIAVYLVGLYFSIGWTPDFWLLTQMLLLTTAKGLVMVSGAVVVSSQTTSVRAANLLASFIIVPMTLLLQAEAILLFWGNYGVIWLIILALLVVDLILVRMGVRIFNREEILSNEMDTLNPSTIWRDFKGCFLRPPQQALKQDAPLPRLNPLNIWRNDIPYLMKIYRLPLAVVLGFWVVAIAAGTLTAPLYPLPPGMLDLNDISMGAFKDVDRFSVLPGLGAGGIFMHNVRALIVSVMLGVFSFGSLALIIFMLPMLLVGYFAGAVNLMGYNAWLFLAAFVLPHGIFEVPAAVISITFTLRIGAALVSPPKGLDVGQGFLWTLANFSKIFLFLVIPLLLAAAFVEAEITPLIVHWVYAY